MIFMIHNSSSDPVLIKKISLKVWSLRDEIEARIQTKVEAGEIAPENAEAAMKELRNEYTKKVALPNNVLQLKPDSALSNDQDEMARAMAAVAEEEGTPEAAEEKLESTEDNKAALLPEAAITSPVENVIRIDVAPPQIAEEKISKGKTVLSEIDMIKMLFFSSKPFTEGQSIVVQFCIPKTFLINADVLYCRTFNIKSRIISQNNFNYRMMVQFTFLKEGERALLRQFIQSIEPDVTKVVKKVEVTNSEEDDGDFGDLGL